LQRRGKRPRQGDQTLEPALPCRWREFNAPAFAQADDAHAQRNQPLPHAVGNLQHSGLTDGNVHLRSAPVAAASAGDPPLPTISCTFSSTDEGLNGLLITSEILVCSSRSGARL